MARGRLFRSGDGIVGACAALTVLLVGFVYAASERALHRTFEIALPDIEIPTDSASIAEGGRLTEILGCRGSHGAELEGRVFQDDFEARIVAPDLTRVAAEYSPAELARAIRWGVRANGEGMWQMPSVMYHHLSDDDVGRVIAYLRAAPRVEGGSHLLQRMPRSRSPGRRARASSRRHVGLLPRRLPAPHANRCGAGGAGASLDVGGGETSLHQAHRGRASRASRVSAKACS